MSVIFYPPNYLHPGWRSNDNIHRIISYHRINKVFAYCAIRCYQCFCPPHQFLENIWSLALGCACRGLLRTPLPGRSASRFFLPSSFLLFIFHLSLDLPPPLPRTALSSLRTTSTPTLDYFVLCSPTTRSWFFWQDEVRFASASSGWVWAWAWAWDHCPAEGSSALPKRDRIVPSKGFSACVHYLRYFHPNLYRLFLTFGIRHFIYSYAYCVILSYLLMGVTWC